eukprot:UN04626
MFVVGLICGFIILASITSILILKSRYCECFCSVFITPDNKFRLLCIVKTTLLLFKQILITQLIKYPIWQWVFGILSVVSLFTIMTLTYAFDKDSINDIISNKRAELFYITYGVSYIITNLSASLIVISSLFYIPKDSIETLIMPFTFLYFTKLYNNEYSRFKEQRKREFKRDIDKKQLPTSIQTLYYFQCVVVMMSLMTFVVLILFQTEKEIGYLN